MMPVRSFEIFVSFKAGIADRLLHGDVIPGGAAAQKAHGAAVDRLAGVKRRRAVHLAAEAKLGIFVGAHNAGFRLAQRRQHFLRIVADGRDDAHPGDDDASHVRLFSSPYRPPMPPLDHGACVALGAGVEEQADLEIERAIDDSSRQPRATHRRCPAPAFERITRLMSMPYTTFLIVGST